MVRPFRRRLAVSFAMILAVLAIGPATAQEGGGGGGGAPTVTEKVRAATDKPEKKTAEKEESLAKKFDDFIDRINGLIKTSLFWSVTGDLFEKTEFANERGIAEYVVIDENKTGNRTGAMGDIPGGKVRAEGGWFVDAQGRLVVLMDPDGTPLFVAMKGTEKEDKENGLRVVDASGKAPVLSGKTIDVRWKKETLIQRVPGKEGKNEDKDFSFLKPEIAIALKLSVRGRFEQAGGVTAWALGPDGKIRNRLGDIENIPGGKVKPDANGILVDDKNRPVAVVSPDGTPLALADSQGRLIGPSGELLTIRNSEGKEIAVRYRNGFVVNEADNGPVSIVHDKNKALKGGLQVASRIATLQQKRRGIGIPFLIVVLVFGAIFFTFWFRWINVRAFRHCIDVIRGKYDRPEDTGEISHFRALTSALSATVGLGNIAGVAIAIQQGGPGAVFWMWVAAVFGMTAKFSSCTLAQLYRKENADGSISGGPMYYLDLGLRSKGGIWGPVGKVLAVMFAIMVMGGAIGGGNMFQANQSFMAFSSVFGVPDSAKYAFGFILAASVGMVILGGIKRIGAATSKIVPIMCGLYVLASIFILLANIGKVPQTFGLIFSMAFSKNAFLGGLIGVLIIGVQRAAFSNEAGLGSAAIAHAAAKTDEPVREGIVAMIGPFIDTIVVCTMTALVVVITGMWDNPEVGAGAADAGVALTVAAYSRAIPYFEFILAVCIVLFAYSTMISWCYYGERGWIYLVDHAGEGKGLKSVVVFRILFVTCAFVGSVASLGAVLGFSDLMILCMAFPNIVGSVILAPLVLEKVKDYWGRYKSGEMKPYSP